jgi:hypothetical protein
VVSQYCIDLNQISRWEGGGLLTTLIFAHGTLLLLALVVFRNKLLLDVEKQKLMAIKYFLVKGKIFSKQWKHA